MRFHCILYHGITGSFGILAVLRAIHPYVFPTAKVNHSYVLERLDYVSMVKPAKFEQCASKTSCQISGHMVC